MTELGTILAVVVGGAITLLATVLANYLQYLQDKRERKRERRRERLDEVRRYLMTCLQLADQMCGGLSRLDLGREPGRLAWLAELSRFAQEADFGALAGSQGVLFVDDDAVENSLEELRGLARDMVVNVMTMEREVAGAKDRVRDSEELRKLISVAKRDREKMKELARKVQARCEELIDET